MIEFDTSKHPARPAEWNNLAAAIHAADPKDESGWLECKGPMDWKNSNHLGTVSRAIIAMANRDRATALEQLDGYAVVAVGLEPGKVFGVEPLDLADLDQKLATYLGPDGPRWTAIWVVLEGKSVLLIQVDPPKIGDPPYALQAGTNDLKKSQVFIRVKARSVAADQGQINRLAERYAKSPDSPVGIQVTARLDASISPISEGHDQIEQYLLREEARLLRSLDEYVPMDKPEPNSADTSGQGLRGVPSFAQQTINSLIGSSTLEREDRTPEEFRARVAHYLADLREKLPEALDEIGGAAIAYPTILASNPTDQNYHAVRITLRVAGLASVTERNENQDSLRARLPSGPRKYGDQIVPFDFGVIDALKYGIAPFPITAPYYPSASNGPSRREMRNGGSFKLLLDELDLRPWDEDIVVEDEAVFLIPTARTDSVLVTWDATASNVGGSARGSFTVPVEGPPVSLFTVFG